MFVAMVVVSFIGIEVTSQNWFCNSCHIMNSYYKSWQAGSHNMVDCVQCHIPPGATNYVWAKLNGLGQVVDDLLRRTSSNPSAFVSDSSCTRDGCHDLAAVRATTRRDTRYLFDHAKHLGAEYDGIGIRCTTCHSHVQGNSHFEVNTNACIACHFLTPDSPGAVQLAADARAAATQATRPQTMAAKTTAKAPPRKCDTCHRVPDKPIEYRGLRVVHSEFVEYGAGCESCHRGVTEEPRAIRDDHCFGCHDFGKERLTDATQLHRVHSEGNHKVECFGCHGVVRHGPSAQSMRLDQFDCRSCHTDQHAIQQKAYKATEAVAARPPHESPSVTPMFLAHVDCTGCHVQPRPLSIKSGNGARVAAATPEACDSCHKPGLGRELVPKWQNDTKALYASVEKLLPPAGQGLAPQAQALVGEARHLLLLVKHDGSWGVHNPRYTQRLLEQAQQKIRQATQATTGPATQP
jgi:nitrate/TMAO reductase-like tetraheme cytochrome c subunit